ncbi:MAG TPA: hypothetical protein VJG83_05030 [archaeon]|nr:hypothetical protein [archaeon]
MGFDLLKGLQNLLDAFEKEDPPALKSLGNELIRRACAKTNYNLANISVIAYSLYKILSKEHFVKNPKWQKVSESIRTEITRAIKACQKEDYSALNIHLGHVIQNIESIDRDLSNYARNIFEKAKIKQASTAYAIGLSLNQAASITGADRKELQKYIGITTIHDEIKETGIEQRMKILRGVLK